MSAGVASDRLPVLAAVDWGTSSFRLWLLDAAGTVVAERRGSDGMATLQPDQFEPVLRRHLAAAGVEESHPDDPLPVIVCGMAGARQGWREAGYVDVPAAVDAIADTAIRVPAAGLDVRILPGLAQRNPTAPDVMRGEETQLLGLCLAERQLTATVVMPGTHSKWVNLRGGRVEAFRTVMTGELFALLGRQSTLKHAIADSAEPTDLRSNAFLEGVTAVRRSPTGVIGNLFSIRAASLLFGGGGQKPADRLSGLLIGAELAEGLAFAGSLPIRLVAGERFGQLYQAAFRQFDCDIAIVDADQLVLDGLRHAAGRIWPGGFGINAGA